MAKTTKTPPQDDGALVPIVLAAPHELPGTILRPGRHKVNKTLRDQLEAAGKLAKE